MTSTRTETDESCVVAEKDVVAVAAAVVGGVAAEEMAMPAIRKTTGWGFGY